MYLARLYKKLKTVKKVAEASGFTRYVVYYHLSRLPGFKLNKRGCPYGTIKPSMRRFSRERARELRRDGFSDGWIAAKLGVKTPSIWEALLGRRK
jgi:hypothetical protein